MKAKSRLPRAGLQAGLGHCYYNSGLLALEQGDKQNEAKKLQRALALFMELKMTLQREAVQATLS